MTNIFLLILIASAPITGNSWQDQSTDKQLISFDNLVQELCIEQQDTLETPGFDENGIWQPDSLKYDPNGFCVDGKYCISPYNDPKIYDLNLDPNGFDKYGIHFQTHSIYDKNLCSQKGLTIGDGSCSLDNTPYYWMLPDKETAGSNFLAASNNDLAKQARQTIKSEDKLIHHSIVSIRKQFYDIQSILIILIDSLDIDPMLMRGPDDLFISEGMYDRFKIRPGDYKKQDKVPQIYNDINESFQELYDLDEKLFHLRAKSESLKKFNEPQRFRILISELEFIILTSSNEEIKRLENSTFFKTWLTKSILNFSERNN